MTSRSPYSGEDYGDERFWRTGVADVDPMALQNVYRKRFDIKPIDRIATAGSCFAQHIASHLGKNGFNLLNVEPAPPGISSDNARLFQYGAFSARYGNMYSVRHLLQLAREAFGLFKPGEIVWSKEQRYFDAMRPTVEPNGLDSPDEVIAHRNHHLQAVRRMLERCNVFIFTFGLTECWMHRSTQTVFPTAPGVIAGDYDTDRYEFHNLSFGEVVQDFLEFRSFVKSFNESCRFIVTVSPVPLTATASENHILVATAHSKAILRAAAAELYAQCPDVDYFPSYEIITNVAARGAFFETNLRSVRRSGVDCAMAAFFDQHRPKEADKSHAQLDRNSERQSATPEEAERDVACEDAFLDAFAGGSSQ